MEYLQTFPHVHQPPPVRFGLIYRKIAPGYEVYSRMGIYERDLSSHKERPLVENTLVKGMCVNCHAFNRTDPSHFSLQFPGTKPLAAFPTGIPEANI